MGNIWHPEFDGVNCLLAQNGGVVTSEIINLMEKAAKGVRHFFPTTSLNLQELQENFAFNGDIIPTVKQHQMPSHKFFPPSLLNFYSRHSAVSFLVSNSTYNNCTYIIELIIETMKETDTITDIILGLNIQVTADGDKCFVKYRDGSLVYIEANLCAIADIKEKN